MEEFYLSFFLSSLVIGMIVLILLEKRKTSRQETTLRNPIAAPQTQEDPKATMKTEKFEEEKENTNSTVKDVEESVTTVSSSSSSCSSSGSEEEESRQPRVSQRPKKKHVCKGSAILCATKRKVTAVTIVTDSQEDEVQVSLEDLAGEIRTNGLTCTVHPAVTHFLPPLSNELSHLLLVFGTSSQGCHSLQGVIKAAMGGEEALPTSQPFLYSVTCWSAAAVGEVYESAKELGVAMGSWGGAEWLPLACISPNEPSQGESTAMGREEYVTTVMDKLTKPGKKCCGSSCGSKTVDIEDLASSLLLSRAAVTS